MADFNIAFKETLPKEGGYSNRGVEDAGGETMYGITKLTAIRNRYFGRMKDLPLEKANEIYRKEYWDRLRLSEVQSQKIANELFDTAVNCGTTFAAKSLQQVLNVLNREEKDWKDISTDGKVGPVTISTLNAAFGKGRESSILLFLNVMQGARYVELAQNPTRHDELNINGWAQRIKLNG